MIYTSVCIWKLYSIMCAAWTTSQRHWVWAEHLKGQKAVYWSIESMLADIFMSSSKPALYTFLRRVRAQATRVNEFMKLNLTTNLKYCTSELYLHHASIDLQHLVNNARTKDRYKIKPRFLRNRTVFWKTLFLKHTVNVRPSCKVCWLPTIPC